jgi:uncharacterized protein YuzE
MKRRHLEGKGEFDYDYLDDILFFKVKDREYSRSIEMDRFTLDIDEENFIVGIQIFDASEFFGIRKEILRNVSKWQFQASMDNNRLEFRLMFQAVFRNKIIEPRPIIIEELKEKLPDSKVICGIP